MDRARPTGRNHQPGRRLDKPLRGRYAKRAAILLPMPWPDRCPAARRRVPRRRCDASMRAAWLSRARLSSGPGRRLTRFALDWIGPDWMSRGLRIATLPGRHTQRPVRRLLLIILGRFLTFMRSACRALVASLPSTTKIRAATPCGAAAALFRAQTAGYARCYTTSLCASTGGTTRRSAWGCASGF